METNGILSVSSRRVKLASVKKRNLFLRLIADNLEHKVALSEHLMAVAVDLFSDIKHFHGCEKCFYEAMIAMHFSGNEQLQELAENFQTLTNCRAR